MPQENPTINELSGVTAAQTSRQERSPWHSPVRYYALALLLAALAVALFWPATRHSFMMIDDGEYVTDHALVPLGLTWTGVGYAFVARHSGNWHPLTTISHMLDCEMFGLDPFGHHLVNIIIHGLNAGILFLFLRSLTGRLWPSFFVAGFFAFHPLRVESVAWVSERKDVLCAFFYLLALWAYGAYVKDKRSRSPGSSAGDSQGTSAVFGFWRSRYYIFAIIFFALSLLSKPMAVTLPFVLLLLDFWPLERFQLTKMSLRDIRRLMRELLPEKIPFFVLTLVDSYITTQVQSRAMAELDALPVFVRLANMFLSYGQYISKTFLPDYLAVVYPYYITSVSIFAVALMVSAVGVISLLAWRWRNRIPWFLVGWCWFLGTLIPVIGLVQVGIQACADRYTYLPCIGLVVIFVWLLADVARGRIGNPEESTDTSLPSTIRSWPRLLLSFLSVAAFFLLALGTRAQLFHWRSNEALMDHTFRTAGDSELARNCLGYLALHHGRLEEAVRQFRAGLNLNGNSAGAMLGLAAAYDKQGKKDQAENLYRKALQRESNSGTLFQLADFLSENGRADEARIHYIQGLAKAPYHLPGRIALGNLYAKQANWPAAREQFERALESNPNHAGAHVSLAGVLFALGKDDEAVVKLRAAIRLAPNWPEPINNLAWRLATRPGQARLDVSESLALARQAVTLTGTNDFEILDTLAAAQAANGHFQDAVQTMRQSLDLAIKVGQTNQLSGLSNRLELYQNERPCCP